MHYNQSSHSDISPRHATRGGYIVFLVMIGIVFFGLTAVFLFLPRSTYSEVEKRDLATFPHPDSALADPQGYTAAVSSWFSDTEPYRDHIMTASRNLRDAFRFRFSDPDEAISFKATAPVNPDEADAPPSPIHADAPVPQVNPLADANAKVANAGIIVVSSAPNVRALMAYGGLEKQGQPFLELIDKFRTALPSQQLYAVIIPTAAEFYLPDKAAGKSRPQKPTLDYVRANLDPTVRYVDVHAQLGAHINEDIFLRTDHHWAPLGAFYAARALATEAGLPFRDLSNYDRHIIPDYVGSMYGYSNDISVKNSPEDFVYYTPRDAGEKTTYITYKVGKNFQITDQRGPYEGEFFHKYPAGSPAAYCTFMGGDSHIVRVQTRAPNNRRLLIIKDSYGNAVPGFLFYTFNEIHVIDFRYFTKNLPEYVTQNGITDIALTFNIFTICSRSAMNKVSNFLTQQTH